MTSRESIDRCVICYMRVFIRREMREYIKVLSRHERLEGKDKTKGKKGKYSVE